MICLYKGVKSAFLNHFDTKILINGLRTRKGCSLSSIFICKNLSKSLKRSISLPEVGNEEATRRFQCRVVAVNCGEKTLCEPFIPDAQTGSLLIFRF